MHRAPMKPETIARRAAEHVANRADLHAQMMQRTKDNAERDGPGSWWADYYADLLKAAP
jgi:hypothetical protein